MGEGRCLRITGALLAIFAGPGVELQPAFRVNSVTLVEVAGELLGAVTVATGMPRGELLAVRLADVDLDKGTVRVERSLEETKAGLRFKAPKTAHGRLTISLPMTAVAVLREHRRKLLQLRLALGLGKPDADTLLFSHPDGSPIPPNRLTLRWQDACASLDLPRVSFHALRPRTPRP
jgi:integrase